MAFTVRQAGPEDLDAFRFVGFSKCPATYGSFAGPRFVVRQLDRWWGPDRLEPALERGDCLVAIHDDGTIVGVSEVGAYDGDLVMWKLYVLPSHQGEGIGRSLLEAVQRLAAHRRLPLVTEYIAGNTRAGAFYRSHGFVEVSVPVSPLDSVWLRHRGDG